jgi:hypothetical protein
MRYFCPYCGDERGSESGTPSDIECCGEIGHCVTEEEYEALWAQNDQPKETT